MLSSQDVYLDTIRINSSPRDKPLLSYSPTPIYNPIVLLLIITIITTLHAILPFTHPHLPTSDSRIVILPWYKSDYPGAVPLASPLSESLISRARLFPLGHGVAIHHSRPSKVDFRNDQTEPARSSNTGKSFEGAPLLKGATTNLYMTRVSLPGKQYT